jgi:adenylate kinase family enzyme
MTADNFVNISGGNVQGFIYENNGNVTLNFINQVSEWISPQASGTEQPLNQEEYRQRTVLLSKVKEYWIKGVLEKSLHTKAMIELGLEKRSDAVERPFSGFEELPQESRQILPTGTGATEVFNQIGEGRTLLILGEPGAGKTITLLKLAQNLIARLEGGLSQLIPVVFNLSSWGSKRQTIVDWLIQELWNKYQVPKEVGNIWVKNQKLLLLLDGLDEVKADRREACVEAINQFTQKHGQTEMVVCSRMADYEVLSNRLQLRGAIYIRSLTPEQVNQYLDAAGEQLGAVKSLLTEDTALQELAKSPLTLSILTLAYQGKKVEELPQTGSVEERREHLFNTYIERMFKRKGVNQQYPKDQAIYRLTWLAQRMSQASQSVFLIEKIQPNWLQSNLERKLYRIGTILIGILVIGLILFLSRTLDSHNESINLTYILEINGVMWGLVLYWNFGRGKAEIETFETLTWPWKKTRKDLLDGLIYGLRWSLILCPIGIAWCYLTWDKPDETSDPLEIAKNAFKVGTEASKIVLFGIILGLIFALIIGLIRGLRGSEIETKTIPNQGIRRSATNAVIIVLVSWLILFLIIFRLFPQGLQSRTSIISWGLILGLLFGGGIACIQHFSLRLILWGKGFIPSNLARFLDYASDRIFLQKVGGGYIFVHRMLLEHFATRIHPTQSEIRNAYKTIKIIFVGGVIVVSSIVVYKIYLNNAEYQLSTQANMLISTMDSVRKYNNDYITPLLETQSEQKFLKESIPTFAVNQVFDIFTSAYKDNYGDYLYKSAMINPTNLKLDQATLEEVKIIETLKQKDLGNKDQLQGQNIDQGYVNVNGKNYFYTSRPIKITDKNCLSCHSTLEKAPQSLQLLYKQGKYGANQGLGWEFNTVIGAKVVYVPTTEVHKIAQRDFIILLGVFIIGIFAVVIIERAIAKN